ncbi:hypothetical protein SAMN04488005_0781 [Yoonia tamlensis]|uniref:Uncharacterized protein n=1 Tax=Yoonia tamlensis TaxID=390270 RepID=A0A1I6FZ37_9RHOB|nr:hypothetical protein SAMN04488005_0781 [Yoonia tamlensis]
MPEGASPVWTLFALIANRAVMSDKQNNNSKSKPATNREDRLKAALKANMAKRKAQARARAAEPDKKEKE